MDQQCLNKGGKYCIFTLKTDVPVPKSWHDPLHAIYSKAMHTLLPLPWKWSHAAETLIQDLRSTYKWIHRTSWYDAEQANVMLNPAGRFKATISLFLLSSAYLSTCWRLLLATQMLQQFPQMVYEEALVVHHPELCNASSVMVAPQWNMLCTYSGLGLWSLKLSPTYSTGKWHLVTP